MAKESIGMSEDTDREMRKQNLIVGPSMCGEVDEDSWLCWLCPCRQNNRSVMNLRSIANSALRFQLDWKLYFVDFVGDETNQHQQI